LCGCLRALIAQLDERVEKAVQEQAGSSHSGWILPFLVLVALVGAAATYAYLKYKKLMKTHLL
jgi:hypothetical protein